MSVALDLALRECVRLEDRLRDRTAERDRLLKAIDSLKPALAKHYQTGDYVGLGIAAHDMLLALGEDR